MFALLLMLLPQAFADCPDPAVLVTQAEEMIVSVKLDEAKARLSQAGAAFACSPPAKPELLGRLWLAQGVLSAIRQQPADADLALGSAALVAPGRWDARYGDVYRAQWSHAGAALTGQDRGWLTLTPAPDGWSVWIDGQPSGSPATLTAGLHLVQIGQDGVAEYGRILYLPPKENLTLDTGLTPRAVSVVAPPPPPTTEDRPTPPPPPPVDMARVDAEAKGLRVKAAREWGAIDAKTQDTSVSAERDLARYVDHYASASVRVDGQDFLIDIPQVREAQRRLDALPQRRAEEEEIRKSKADFERDIQKSTPVADPGWFDFAAVVGVTAVSAGEPAAHTDGYTARGFGGVGPTLVLASAYRIHGRLGVGAQLGFQGALGAAPEADPPALSPLDDSLAAEAWSEPQRSHLRLGTGALQARLLWDRLSVGVGPLYAVGVAAATGVVASESDATWEDTAYLTGSVRMGGLCADLRTALLHAGPVDLGPSLQAGAATDSVRWYSWGTLSVAVSRKPQ